jgi:hypothetical protein
MEEVSSRLEWEEGGGHLEQLGAEPSSCSLLQATILMDGICGEARTFCNVLWRFMWRTTN